MSEIDHGRSLNRKHRDQIVFRFTPDELRALGEQLGADGSAEGQEKAQRLGLARKALDAIDAQGLHIEDIERIIFWDDSTQGSKPTLDELTVQIIRLQQVRRPSRIPHRFMPRAD